MILPDVNLLSSGSHSADSRHDKARSCWESTPMSVKGATRRVQAWLEHPNVTVLLPGRRFPTLFLTALESLETAGKLATDARLAALAIEHRAEVHHSNDADVSRFAGLRWRHPLV